jgi:hypothetical protein
MKMFKKFEQEIKEFYDHWIRCKKDAALMLKRFKFYQSEALKFYKGRSSARLGHFCKE